MRQSDTGTARQHHRQPLKDRLEAGASPSMPKGQHVDLLGERRLLARPLTQRNRRTCNSITTARPPTALSARRRTYRLCTRVDTVPQAGHAAWSAAVLARTTTDSSLATTFSIRTPSTWWNHRSWRSTSPTAVHDRGCGDPPWPWHGK